MPKDDCSTDRASDPDAEPARADGQAGQSPVSTSGGHSGSHVELNDYILDMITQLADLAAEIGNDELARNLAKAVRLARISERRAR